MDVDICIVSDAKTKQLEEVTREGIASLFLSEDEIKFNVFVVESNREVSYPGCEMVEPVGEFGYHRYLNLAVEKGRSEYVVLCNNDLVYEKNWAGNIIREMLESPGLMSASPFCPQVHHTNSGPNVQLGYQIKYKLAGWCIFQQRRIYNIIGKLDEDVLFWYSDNVYAEQLKRNRILHGLVMNSVVNHHGDLLGATGKLLEGEERKRMTSDQRRIFTGKYGT